MQEYITNQIDEAISNLVELKNFSKKIRQIALICNKTIRNGRKIIFCGNGGSAAQSQHLTAELVGRYKLDRPAISAISLTVDTSNITAISNDYNYESVFSRQLEAIGNEGDTLIGLSTSGNSKNVVKAFESARRMKITTIALIGRHDGLLNELSDYIIQVPADTSAHIQELHIVIGHIICDLIEKEFYEI